MSSDLIIRSVTRQDYAQWLPLWDGYNAFYGRAGATALAPEITRMTWARFFDAYEPVHALVAERGGRTARPDALSVSPQHHRDRAELLSAGSVHQRSRARQRRRPRADRRRLPTGQTRGIVCGSTGTRTRPITPRCGSTTRSPSIRDLWSIANCSEHRRASAARITVRCHNRCAANGPVDKSSCHGCVTKHG